MEVIIYNPQQQLIYAGLREENTYDVLKHPDGSYIDHSGGENILFTLKTVKHTGWKIVGVSYMDELVTSKDVIGNFVLLVLLIGILFVV